MTSRFANNSIAVSVLCLLMAISCHGCIATSLVGWDVTGTIIDSDQRPIENARLEVSVTAGEKNWTKQVATDAKGTYKARITTGTKCTLMVVPWILMSPPAGPPKASPDQVAIHSIEELTIVNAAFPFEETKHRVRRSFPWPVVMGGEITLPTVIAQNK